MNLCKISEKPNNREKLYRIINVRKQNSPSALGHNTKHRYLPRGLPFSYESMYILIFKLINHILLILAFRYFICKQKGCFSSVSNICKAKSSPFERTPNLWISANSWNFWQHSCATENKTPTSPSWHRNTFAPHCPFNFWLGSLFCSSITALTFSRLSYINLMNWWNFIEKTVYFRSTWVRS